MDRYKNYGIEELVWDLSFRQWVLSPTRENDLLWKTWLSENPECKNKVDHARQVVAALRVHEEDLPDEEIRKVVGKTIERIKAPGNDLVLPLVSTRRFYQSLWFQIAASVLILVVSGLSVKNYRSGMKKESGGLEMSAKYTEGQVRMIEKVNDGDRHILVQLSDNSRVTLAPGSKIRYTKYFTGVRREVTLTGEAFFDIARDVERPFLVYSNELVTKVLGTSFRVKAYPSSKEVTVEVKTGRVSVFAKSDPHLQDKLARRELEGIILSPNQKIIFERQAVRMVKTLIEKPEMVLPKSQIPYFTFEDTPASEAFASIGKAYGIDIIYDESVLSGCPLTAELDNQPLHEKLSIICKAVEAEYEILDGQVIIHSRGCRN
ncbi:FecR family protein [Dyadobacter sp. LHD-138]|uniref:FecR family protein n=1 Tax=Dyadobacter sp. LHD-138 TaxID=3071413 RepID=UPI0027E172BD|nr:FecR family protein [Dyadobacter sp. LHD-138]MDQ6481698.1 FecR family protein [Dyadobacter sp. LHD-138]